VKPGNAGLAPPALAGPAHRGAAARQPSFWARSRYRIGQFLHGWRAQVTEADKELAMQVLGPQALRLFEQMPADAQAHSLRVLRSLPADDAATIPVAALSPALTQAALLHDVGKVAALQAGAYLGLWLRGPIVLIEAACPAWLHRLADARPGPTLGYALYVQLEHARIGAEMARQAGCDPLTCWLIAHHQDSAADAVAASAVDFPDDLEATDFSATDFSSGTARRCLARLQQADSKN